MAEGRRRTSIDEVTVMIPLAVWGLRRELLLVLISELMPGLNLFPIWVAVVVYLRFCSA